MNWTKTPTGYIAFCWPCRYRVYPLEPGCGSAVEYLDLSTCRRTWEGFALSEQDLMARLDEMTRIAEVA